MASAVRPLGSLSMARGCARIDAGPDTAKIGSADRVQVHHARLLAVIGVRKTFPHGLGQKRKSRPCAGHVCSSPDNGHWTDIPGRPFSAIRLGHSQLVRGLAVNLNQPCLGPISGTAGFQQSPVVLQQAIDDKLQNGEPERCILKIKLPGLAFRELVKAAVGAAYHRCGALLILGEDTDFS